jgi:hypothetical protein
VGFEPEELFRVELVESAIAVRGLAFLAFKGMAGAAGLEPASVGAFIGHF